MGIQEKEREQETESLCVKRMMENIINLVKEIDIQMQKAQRVPNEMNPKRLTPRHIITKMSKVKHKEQILKTTREKQLFTYKGAPKTVSLFFNKIFSGQKGLARNI